MRDGYRLRTGHRRRRPAHDPALPRRDAPERHHDLGAQPAEQHRSRPATTCRRSSPRAASPVASRSSGRSTPHVRQFPRVGGMNGAKLQHLARHLDFRRGRIAEHANIPSQKRLWDDEWYPLLRREPIRLRRRLLGLRAVLGDPAAALPGRAARDLAAQRPGLGCAPRGERREEDAAQPHADLHPLRAVRPPRVGLADAVGDQPRGPRRVRGARASSCRRSTPWMRSTSWSTRTADLHEAAFDEETGDRPRLGGAAARRRRRDDLRHRSGGCRRRRTRRASSARSPPCTRANPKTRLVIVGSGPLEDELTGAGRGR